MDIDIFQKYCTGCGLCGSVCNVIFKEDERGFNIPQLKKDDLEFCNRICPAGGVPSAYISGKEIWGSYNNVYLGWASSKDIRKVASSGGVLTAICCYLIENSIVDGIINTKKDDIVPYKTRTVISKTKEEVLSCMGSRYSISSPLLEINKITEKGKKYAFVGKPCDVAALRLYLKENNELRNSIVYFLSFFCAGEPSVIAQKKLLNELGCTNENDCVFLQYRGDGWPGYAMAESKDGTIKRITYNDSWGKVLGRDVRKCCRVCIDGIGEYADIACGDAWYLNSDGKPDFSERNGRNVVFSRTDKGLQLLSEAKKQGYLELSDYQNNINDLKAIQQYQYDRRTTMSSMLFIMKIFARDVPQYSNKTLKNLGKPVSLTRKIKRGIGTIKRIKQGKL